MPKQNYSIIAIKCFLIILWISITDITAQNNVVSYIELGSSTPINKSKHGISFQTKIALSKDVELQTGIRFANQYPSGMGNIKAGIKIYPSKKDRRWSFDNVVNYSNYSPYPIGQLYYRITGSWQKKHFKVDVGNSFVFSIGRNIVKYNLFYPSFSLKGIIRDEDKPWNIALFIRNFNRFEVFGPKAIEWGTEITTNIKKNWKLFCEPNITTAGNFNGTATFYNFNCHIGGAYIW